MPLSEGHVEGEIIRCPYHGLEFGATGSCTRIPGQERIPASANVRSYPVHEKDGFIWIWMGDPALADPATYNDMERMRQLTEAYQQEQDKTEALYEALENAENALTEADA